MIVKLNKVLEAKLAYMAKHGKIEPDDMVIKVFESFIKRFEEKNGVIDLEPKTKGPRKANLVFQMYEYYKEFYQEALGKKYEIDPKKKNIDMRHIKTVRNKIIQSISDELKVEVMSVKDEDVLGAFKFVLNKTPDWWVKNSFAPSSLASNYEKIMIQIRNPKTNGRGSNKAALDDYFVELTTNGS